MALSKNGIHLVIDAVCFVDDCLEFGSEDLFNMMKDSAGHKLLEALDKKSEDLQLVQSCIFGLGVLAKRYPAPWDLLPQTLEAITGIYAKNPVNDEGKRHECMDNAISSFAKCVYFHQNEKLDTPAVV